MKKYMKNFAKYVAGVCIGSVLLSSCIRDGMDGEDCYSYVRFIYDYNMEYVDLFPQKASLIDLYIFDENGVFVKEAEDHNGSYAADFKMLLPVPFERKTYNLVAWSGLHDQSYAVTSMVPGVSTMQDLMVQLQAYEDKYVDCELHPLWQGSLKVQVGVRKNEVFTVELMKNTKKFRVVMQNLDGSPINVHDYNISLHSANGKYDHTNTIQDNHDQMIQYDPYHTANDVETGAVAELNTMRLSTERAATLSIKHNGSGQSLDIPLKTYINALRLQEHAHMPLQEYMDREDAYHVMMFFTPRPGGQEGYLSVDVSVVPWYVRDNEVD